MFRPMSSLPSSTTTSAMAKPRRLARLCPARQHRLSPHHLGVVQARSDRGRGTAPRSSDLLAAQAMDPRHPSGVGEPQTSRRLPRGVYLPVQPPPRTPDYSRSRAAPWYRHDNPTASLLENRLDAFLLKQKPDSPSKPDGHGYPFNAKLAALKVRATRCGQTAKIAPSPLNSAAR